MAKLTLAVPAEPPSRLIGMISEVCPGLVSTAGNVLFSGGPSDDLVALDATTGQALWHAFLNGPVTNGPITYELDGRQYVVAAADDTLWSFVLNPAPANAPRLK